MIVGNLGNDDWFDWKDKQMQRAGAYKETPEKEKEKERY